MDFPYGDTPVRQRAQQVADPYNPSRTVEDWTLPTVDLPLTGCYINSTSTNVLPAAARTQQDIYKSLFSPDPTVDVKVGDRILDVDGYLYQIKDRPVRDRNPFTGWQPIAEIPLTGVQG